MARILCSWEIGDGHGHVRNLIAVGQLLRAAGHEVVFALSASQVTAHKLVEAEGWNVERFILPHYPSLTQYLAPLQAYRANSFLDVLGFHAFDDGQRLQPIAQRLVDIIQDNRIDVVLAETAPVTMLAAKLLNVPCLGIGTSFGLPEMEQGFASYIQYDHFPNTPIFTESALLKNINALGKKQFSNLADALLPQRMLPFCYPSIDHYGHQRTLSNRGVGPIWKMDKTELPAARRGFAYLQNAYPATLDLVSAIRTSGIPFRVFVRNGKFSSSHNMEVVHSFDLAQEIRDSSFVLHHGSAGFAQAAMTAGVPQICFPYHVENVENAYRLQQLGISKAIGHQQSRDFLLFMLEDDDARTGNARIVADQLAKHANEFPGAVAAAAAAVDDLL